MGDSMQDAQLWAMIGTGTSLTLHVLVSIAWIAIVLGVVWRHRRDAAGTLLFAVSLALVLTCAGPLLTPAVGFFASRSGGPESFLRTNAILQIALSVLALAPQALLMAGVAQLARPARRDVRDPDVGSLGT